MRFEALLKALFPSLVPIPRKSSKDMGDEVARGLVRAYARGNVNLQYGRYLTGEQLEERKHALSRHAF
ncbi:MAG: hypothetical protein HYV16_13465 [Gammaproteobacteria bacterium]|nr:hypothetical protein [Gammaproteobacteria bacterium]